MENNLTRPKGVDITFSLFSTVVAKSVGPPSKKVDFLNFLTMA